MSERVDVLICGSGSAGLCAALWLSRCGISYKILERRSGPLEMGQADGVQTRTVEIFESFGIAEDLLKEAYHVLEVAFWASEGLQKADDGRSAIKRTHYAADVEEGLSHQPHVILNQARINGLMIDEIKRATGTLNIEYGSEVKSVDVDSTAAKDHDAYCVETKAVNSEGIEQVIQSKFVLACDGAHSTVRRSLGFKMVGDSTNSVWGVMDVYPQTDFPDIRKKAVLHSDAGNLLLIPREGDSLVRFYIELQGEAVKDIDLAKLQEKAQKIFHPYTVNIQDTVWWSAYSIGQRLADFFTKDGRVFLSGDACHTHSPKAGQGMNVSLQDGYNIGWKLAAVLKNRCKWSLLDTYVQERQQTAKDLIDFDRLFTKMFSSSYRQEHGISPEDFKNHFVKSGRYTAGQGTHYSSSMLVSTGTDDSALASRLVVGMRFPSAQVVRFCDAKAMQLVKALPATSKWHVIVFAGDLTQATSMKKLQVLSHQLGNIADRYTPSGMDADSVMQGILVIPSDRHTIEQAQIPEYFTPTTGKYRLKCLLKIFSDEKSYNSGHGHAYERYGISRKDGCIVVVRPDHYISMVASLEEFSRVGSFFDEFMIRQVQVVNGGRH